MNLYKKIKECIPLVDTYVKVFMAYIFFRLKPNFQAAACLHPLYSPFQINGYEKKCRAGGAIGIFALLDHTRRSYTTQPEISCLNNKFLANLVRT